MSVSNYRSDHDALQARVEQVQQETMAAKNWLDFIQRHPEVRLGGMANQSIFKAYFASDYPANFTLDALEEAYQNPALRKQLALDDSNGTGERAKLISELQSLLIGSDQFKANELAATKYVTNEQLGEKVTALRSKREMQLKSPAELRTIIKDNRPSPKQVELPAHMTRAFLLNLTEQGAFKKVVERYGAAAVTRRLNQR